jgi:hypothetical protein
MTNPIRRAVRAHLTLYGASFAALAVILAAAPGRFYPAVYEAVTGWIHPPTWALAFAAVGGWNLLVAWRWPTHALGALVAGGLLVGWWAVAFTIGIFASPRTPPTGAMAWGCMLGSHLILASLLNGGVGGTWRAVDH